MDRPERTEVLVAIGPDQRGIAIGLLEIVAKAGCNIEELRMQTLGGVFAVTMRLEGKDDTFASVREQATVWSASKGYHMQMLPDNGWIDFSGFAQYKVQIFELPDRKGLVYSIAAVLMDHNVNFRSIVGNRYSTPDSGEPLYTVDFYIHLESQRLAELKKHLDDLDLDYTIERES
jgi:glycine cleavage system regulatory protein